MIKVDDCVFILGHRFLSWSVDCVGTNRTGLDRDVLICTRQPDMCPIIIVCKENRHTGQNFFDRAQAFVSISDNPCITATDGTPLPDEIWAQVRNWIMLNKESLLRYWNEEIDTADLIEAISSQGMPANTPQSAS